MAKYDLGYQKNSDIFYYRILNYIYAIDTRGPKTSSTHLYPISVKNRECICKIASTRRNVPPILNDISRTPKKHNPMQMCAVSPFTMHCCW